MSGVEVVQESGNDNSEQHCNVCYKEPVHPQDYYVVNSKPSQNPNKVHPNDGPNHTKIVCFAMMFAGGVGTSLWGSCSYYLNSANYLPGCNWQERLGLKRRTNTSLLSKPTFPK
eukprot:1114930-Amphidinium_carterae.1